MREKLSQANEAVGGETGWGVRGTTPPSGVRLPGKLWGELLCLTLGEAQGEEVTVTAAMQSW